MAVNKDWTVIRNGATLWTWSKVDFCTTMIVPSSFQTHDLTLTLFSLETCNFNGKKKQTAISDSCNFQLARGCCRWLFNPALSYRRTIGAGTGWG